jgi:nicotinamide-nucleotide amidase
VLARGATTVISLPGVPPELEAIVEGPLAPTLASLLAGAAYAAEDVIVRTGDESVLAPAVAEAARAFPSVRVKSRARRFGPEVRMAVTLAARGADAAEAKGLVSGARAALLAACAARGLSIG